MGIFVSSLSTQYIQIPVRAFSQGLPYNPTSDTVQMAFILGGVPDTDDWNTASWASTSTISGYYIAQCLVGPANGGVPLAIASYLTWLKVTDSPEIPVINAGTLTITP